MNTQDRNKMVLENLPLVGYLVSDMMSRANHLSREDLFSVGSVALITSVDAFNPALGVPFGAYARQRITGAFADDMRSGDWATRLTRGRIRALTATQELLSSTLNRQPTVDELASGLGLTREATLAAMSDAGRRVVPLDEFVFDEVPAEQPLPGDDLLASERLKYLRAAIDALPDRMKHIIEQVYFEDKTIKEIAELEGVTHSAVSQQRSEAIRMMRDGMDIHYSDEQRTGSVNHVAEKMKRTRASYISKFEANLA